VEAFFNRFIVFSNRSQSPVIALWVLHAWAKDAFDYTPYLHIHSPEKRCGKTLVLDLLGLLVPEPWPVVGPSEAVLFRAIDANEPTLLLDEVDTIFKERDEKSEGLRGILNAGFKRNGSVPRCVGLLSQSAGGHRPTSRHRRGSVDPDHAFEEDSTRSR
jgi:hypothetical protein